MKNLRITVNGTAYDVQVEELGGSSAPAAAAPAPAAAAHPRDGRDVRGGEPFGHPADPLHQVPAPAAPAHGPAAPSL